MRDSFSFSDVIDVTSRDGLARIRQADEYTQQQLDSRVTRHAAVTFANLIHRRAGGVSVWTTDCPTAPAVGGES